jgi:ATP-binding cassette subfamily B protein
MEVLGTSTSVVIADNPVTEISSRAQIQFDHAGFQYPGAELPVLHDISLTVNAGETLAIVGSTGSGKTTFINLVARMFDATSGVVRLDGVDIRDLAPEALWSRVGMVPQNRGK